MDNLQLCLVVGVPIVFNGLVSAVLMVHWRAGMASLGTRMWAFESRMVAFENRVIARCDLVLERLTDFDARLARLAERSHWP